MQSSFAPARWCWSTTFLAMSLVVALKVPTGVAVAGDSRTTFARSIAFDAERKVFRVP